MPKITIPGEIEFEVERGENLLLALIDNGVDVVYRCGGKAVCTKCRCIIERGEPDMMTKAEIERIKFKEEKGEDMTDVRLACQILVEEDTVVKPLLRFKDTDFSDPGPRPPGGIIPTPEWVKKEEYRDH